MTDMTKIVVSTCSVSNYFTVDLIEMVSSYKSEEVKLDPLMVPGTLRVKCWAGLLKELSWAYTQKHSLARSSSQLTDSWRFAVRKSGRSVHTPECLCVLSFSFNRINEDNLSYSAHFRPLVDTEPHIFSFVLVFYPWDFHYTSTAARKNSIWSSLSGIFIDLKSKTKAWDQF